MIQATDETETQRPTCWKSIRLGKQHRCQCVSDLHSWRPIHLREAHDLLSSLSKLGFGRFAADVPNWNNLNLSGITTEAPDSQMTRQTKDSTDDTNLLILASRVILRTLWCCASLAGASGSSLWSIIAIGQTVVLITAGIDLSIGSVVGLSSCIVALMLNKGYPISVSFALIQVYF